MAEPKDELIKYAYQTVCQKRPELCKPRKVEMVFFDADDTMWHISPPVIATNVRGPFNLINPDTLEASEEPFTTSYSVTKPPKPKQAGLGFPPKKKEPEDWWIEQMGPSKEEEELEAIAEELYQSVPTEAIEIIIPPETAAPKEEEKPLFLEELKGLKERQQNAVDKLLRKYGYKACKIIDVNKWGDITVDCKGEVWGISDFGNTYVPSKYAKGKKEKPIPLLPPATEKTKVTYPPRKITITLLPTLRETLDRLAEHKIPISVISLNTPGTVKAILEGFGIADRFVEIKDTWTNKGTVFQDVTEKYHICPCNALFVDNSIGHVEEVTKKCGLSLQIGKGKDVEVPIQILNYIEGYHGGKEA